MAMKSYFMDVDVKVTELQSKTGILEVENKLLKENCSNKKKLIEVVLEHNSVLIREKSKHIVNLNSFMTGAVCRANQWTGFYMITASVMKELMITQ